MSTASHGRGAQLSAGLPKHRGWGWGKVATGAAQRRGPGPAWEPLPLQGSLNLQHSLPRPRTPPGLRTFLPGPRASLQTWSISPCHYNISPPPRRPLGHRAYNSPPRTQSVPSPDLEHSGTPTQHWPMLQVQGGGERPSQYTQRARNGD